MRTRPLSVTAAALVAVLALGGCASPAPESGGQPDPGSARSPTAQPWRVIDGPLARCGPQPAEVATTRFHYRVLRGDVGRIASARVGHGPVVAVLLHQS